MSLCYKRSCNNFMCVSLSLGVIGHQPKREKGADQVSRVWKAVSPRKRTSKSQIQRDVSFYCSRAKVYKGSQGLGQESLIGHDKTPDYQTDLRREKDLGAESYRVCRELCAVTLQISSGICT